MSPEQAFQLLEQATAQLQATRAGHAQIIEALKVIKQLIEKGQK